VVRGLVGGDFLVGPRREVLRELADRLRARDQVLADVVGVAPELGVGLRRERITRTAAFTPRSRENRLPAERFATAPCMALPRPCRRQRVCRSPTRLFFWDVIRRYDETAREPLRRFCLSVECESEPGAQPDSRASSMARARVTGRVRLHSSARRRPGSGMVSEWPQLQRGPQTSLTRIVPPTRAARLSQGRPSQVSASHRFRLVPCC
jgi:hypothetical protein